eukprot:3803738-Pyramimonas_sp.AAC.1
MPQWASCFGLSDQILNSFKFIGNDAHEAICSLGFHAAGPHGSAALTSAQREAVVDHLDANRPLSNYHRELVAWLLTHPEALLHAVGARVDEDGMANAREGHGGHVGTAVDA